MVIQQQIIATVHQETLRQFSVQLSASKMPAHSDTANFNLGLCEKITQPNFQQPTTNASSKMANTLTTVRTPKKRRYNKHKKNVNSNHAPQQQREDSANCKRTRFVMNPEPMRRISKNEEQQQLDEQVKPLQKSTYLSNFISQTPEHHSKQNYLADHFLSQNPANLLNPDGANNLSEPFATPPPSQPPASLLLSPDVDASVNASIEFRRSQELTTVVGLASPQHHHFTYSISNPINSSSPLLAPPEAQIANHGDTLTQKQFLGEDEMKLRLNNAFQQSQNRAITSFISAVTEQQQQQQSLHISKDSNSKTRNSNSSAALCNTTSTALNVNIQTGTTLALNQLIGSSSLFSQKHQHLQQHQQQYESQNRFENQQTVLQERLLTNSDDQMIALPTLLAFLQQQQEIDVATQQAMIVQLTIQKELQMLYQRQQIERLITDVAVQLQQQQNQQNNTPELTQTASQLVLEKNGLSLGSDCLVDQQLKQFGNHFLSPPLTHTPLSLADDLSSASPSSLSLLSANVSRSSPSIHYQQSSTKPAHITENNIDKTTTQTSIASLSLQHRDRYHSNKDNVLKGTVMERNDLIDDRSDLDAFERAIAHQHGGLTERESVAVAVLAVGLTGLWN